MSIKIFSLIFNLIVNKYNCFFFNIHILILGEELGTAFENIAKLILDEKSNVTNEKDSKTCSYIEHPGINKILKKLIQFEAKKENKDDEGKPPLN